MNQKKKKPKRAVKIANLSWMLFKQIIYKIKHAAGLTSLRGSTKRIR